MNDLSKDIKLWEGCHFIQITNVKPSSVFDILVNSSMLSTFSSFELSLCFYPQWDDITSKQYIVEPYQDQIVSKPDSNDRYQKVTDPYAFSAWRAAGMILAWVVGQWNPSNILEIESLFTLWAAWYATYQTWTRMEWKLAVLTKHNNKFVTNPYTHYSHEIGNFLSFLQRARAKRYGADKILPDEVAFRSETNSFTLNAKFKIGSLLTNDGPVNIGSIRFSKEVLDALHEFGFHLGVDIKLWWDTSWKWNQMFSLSQDLEVEWNKTTVWYLDNTWNFKDWLIGLTETVNHGRLVTDKWTRTIAWKLIVYDSK